MKNFDTIFIKDLVVPCILGVSKNERTSQQNVIINIKLSVNTQKAAQTDDIMDTVNYSEIAESVANLVKTSQFHLLETLSQVIANACLQDKRVKQVTVHIEKPKALKLAKSSAIEITRTNEE